MFKTIVVPSNGDWKTFKPHEPLVAHVFNVLRENTHESGGVWKYMGFTSSSSNWDFEIEGVVKVSVMLELDESEKITELSISSSTEFIGDSKLLNTLLQEFGDDYQLRMVR